MHFLQSTADSGGLHFSWRFWFVSLKIIMYFMSADAHWEENKIKSNRNLHNPFWHHGLWDGTPCQRPRSPGEGGWGHWVDLQPLSKSHFSTEPRQSQSRRAAFIPTVAPQHGRAVAGPSGKRVGSQQTWVLAPALPLLAV